LRTTILLYGISPLDPLTFIGVPFIVAISAPTALAIRTANSAGITLVAIARDDGFEVFTHPYRIAKESVAHVA